MNTKMKERLAALGVTGVLLGGSALVFAQTQTTPTPTTPTTPQTPPARVAPEGFKDGRFALGGRGFGFYGLPFGRLALGTSVEVTFYDGDPEAGGQVLETLALTYGEDSEAAFANDFAAAAEEAAFVTVTTSPQAYTVDLSQQGFDSRGFDRGRRGHR